MGMECDSDGEARSSGDFWRWLGGRQQARELELFFSFPLHPIGRHLAASLPKWGPKRQWGTAAPRCSVTKIGARQAQKKGGAFHGGLLLVFLGDQGDLLLL